MTTQERETELDMLQRLRNKGARKWRERDRARYAARTASERQATSHWSTHEHGAETPEERETRKKFSDMALWMSRWRCNRITFNFYTGLPHIYFPIHSFIPVLSLPKRDWIQLLNEHHVTRKFLIWVNPSASTTLVITLHMNIAISMYPVKSWVCTTTSKQTSSGIT